MVVFNPSQTQFVRMAKMGDRKAFDELFAAHAMPLQLYVRYRMGRVLWENLQPADIVQEVFLTAFQSFHAFYGKNGQDLYRWLRWIADCRMADEARKAMRQKRGGGIEFEPAGDSTSLSPIEKTPDSRPGPVTSAVLREQGKKMEEAFAQLSEREQEVILLRQYEGLSSKETAEKLAITANHVDVLLFRAMKKWKASVS